MENEKIKIELTREEIELLKSGLLHQELWNDAQLKDIEKIESGNYPHEIKAEATKLKQRFEFTKQQSQTLYIKLSCLE